MAIERRPDPTGGDRELAVCPASPERAATLTATQVEHYNRDGFVSPVDVFDDDEADQLRVYVDGLLAEVVNADDRRNA